MKLLQRLLGTLDVEVRNFPVTRKRAPFNFLGYDFHADNVLCVTPILEEQPLPPQDSPEGTALPPKKYLFRVFLDRQVSVTFTETEKELSVKKRELFMAEWNSQL